MNAGPETSTQNPELIGFEFCVEVSSCEWSKAEVCGEKRGR